MPRPTAIEAPAAGQESVWDYPRPPRVEDTTRHLTVVLNEVVIADSARAKRVLETSHPPVYYFPPEDVRMEFFTPTTHTTVCEWKGRARYYTIDIAGRAVPNAAWGYPSPLPGYADLTGYVAIYPHDMDGCYVDGERVRPQPGRFYGGWITDDVVGPFKGEPASWDW
jgi:uncharacterized protein (DUF427 family)